MINERKLTERELESRESVLKGLLSNKRNLVKKYGKDAEKVMYGIATKKAKSKVEGMNKDRIKELIQLQLELAPNNKFDDESPKSTEFDSNSNKSYSGGADYGSEVSANTAEDDMEVGELKEDKFSNASMNDVMQSIRNLAHTTGMDEQEAAEIAINEIKIEFGVDAFHESALDRRVAKIDEMVDYDESLNLRAIKAELEGEIQGVRMEMEDEGDESKADYYGDILNRFESRLAKVQRQLDDYDMNENSTPQHKDYYDDHIDIGMFYLEGFGKEHTLTNDQLEKLGKKIVNQLYKGDVGKAYDDIVGGFRRRKSKDIKEGDENLFKPRIVKDKNNPNFLLIHINYPTGAGALVALGKETMSGQQRREGAIKAMKMGNVIAKKLESKYNLEDIEVSDGENGKVTVFAVSDDFINMKSPSIDEKLTKKSSVEDHVEDFKDSDAPQFKGKSKDKKIQMAVASYLSKQGKSVKENKVADKDIEKEIKLLQDENPKGFEKEIKKLKVRQAALKLSK